MNKAIAKMVIDKLVRENNDVEYTPVTADREYLEGIKFIQETEAIMETIGVHDPAYEYMLRQVHEVYRIIEAFAIHFEMKHTDHLNTFKIMASYPIKGWMKDEMFVEEVEVHVSKIHKTNNKELLNKQIESAYRQMKYDQGLSVHALRNLEIVTL